MSRHLIVLAGALVCVCVTATLGCSSTGTADAVEKAQIAVRANPSLELVATDERQGVLTVKVRRSGQMLTVTASDVVAGNAFRDLDAASGGARTSGGGNGSGSSHVTVATPEGQVSVGRSGSGVDVSTSEGRVSVKRSGDGGVGVSTSEGQVGVRRSGDGVAVSTPEGQVSVRRSGDGLSVSTPEGQVTVGAGGVAVQNESRRRESSGDRPSSGANGSASPSSNSAGRGAVIDDSRLERRTRPVSCKGDNSIDLSDVLLRVDDVAVESIGSCVVHIRNSHIVGNVAVQSTGSTTVTIENSIIEGRVALALKGDVMVSVQSSTIRGAVQRVGSTNLRDLGGNLWR